MTTREALYSLVDELPDAALSAAERQLAALRDDPLLRALAIAPVDDEPLTEDERAAIEDAEATYRRGEWVADEDLAW